MEGNGAQESFFGFEVGHDPETTTFPLIVKVLRTFTEHPHKPISLKDNPITNLAL
jgi:hypothetical protein